MIGANLFHVFHQALGRTVQLHDTQVQLAVCDFQRDGAVVQPVGLLVALGFVGFLHQIVACLKLSFFSCSSCLDRKSTRLNSSHMSISYAVFCLKKKTSYSSNSP